MRRACPEMCDMTCEDANDESENALEIRQGSPCVWPPRRGNSPDGKDRPFCPKALARRFGGDEDKLCMVKGMRRACPEMCEMTCGDANDDASEAPPTMAPCKWPARRGNSPDGKDRPFCPRALARRFGGDKSKLCMVKGMRRACPEMCGMTCEKANDESENAITSDEQISSKSSEKIRPFRHDPAWEKKIREAIRE